ncbi:protein LEG1 homolog [Monodon monoceros]|uniref:protein LEG1 homolog n=1 Tax=Monodon monoceros TaxID=40151 RepID=UPI0010F9C788|nr:protein LEG1 homolog [Monodon monoceros]
MLKKQLGPREARLKVFSANFQKITPSKGISQRLKNQHDFSEARDSFPCPKRMGLRHFSLLQLKQSNLKIRPKCQTADPTQRADCGHESGDHLCISVDSWWADLNYYPSAIPFLAMVDSGIMGISSDNVTFLSPSKDQMNFCYNVSSCYSSFPDTMKKWNKFYQQVKSYSRNFDDLLKYLWVAHVSSLKVARKKFHNRLQHYSKQEAEFKSSRALFVDYLAPPLFPSALIRTYGLQKGLPTQMLVSGNKAPFISDFTGFQNTVLLGVNFLHKVYKYTGK